MLGGVRADLRIKLNKHRQSVKNQKNNLQPINKNLPTSQHHITNLSTHHITNLSTHHQPTSNYGWRDADNIWLKSITCPGLLLEKKSGPAKIAVWARRFYSARVPPHLTVPCNGPDGQSS